MEIKIDAGMAVINEIHIQVWSIFLGWRTFRSVTDLEGSASLKTVLFT